MATQSGYYIATGVWALAHRRSFEAVSGRKTDYWLVRTVGALTFAIGAALAAGAREREQHRETVVLAVGSAAAYGAIDAVYASSGRISRIYLLDLAAQLALLASLGSGRSVARLGRGAKRETSKSCREERGV